MRKQTLALVAGALTAATGAQPASATEVTVRVEGEAATLVPKTSVSVPATAPKPDGTNPCAAGSAGAALWAATGGQWGGIHYSFGWFIDSIKGETYSFLDPRSWQFWLNGKSASGGACDTPVVPGDEILYIVARCEMDANYNCTNPPVLPLRLTAPATAAPGQPFSVTVRANDTDGTLSPQQGASVVAGAATAVTAADGTAQLTITQRGPASVAASSTGRVRDAATVCITDGADGFCGTTPAPGVTPPPPGAVTGESCATNGRDGRCGTKDITQPWSRLSAPQHGARFARGKAPRTLSGTVETDGSGIAKIELRLTRRAVSGCAAYSDSRERWVAMRRCGAARGSWFTVGAGQSWSYLLPGALAAGRYVLDVRVTDRAGNVSVLARTYTRSVFTVG